MELTTAAGDALDDAVVVAEVGSALVGGGGVVVDRTAVVPEGGGVAVVGGGVVVDGGGVVVVHGGLTVVVHVARNTHDPAADGCWCELDEVGGVQLDGWAG